MSQIKIESIFGGESQYENFGKPDQFRESYSIEPEFGTTGTSSFKSSGYLRPVPFGKFSGSTIVGSPMWIIPQPKSSVVYVYDSVGSIYSYTTGIFTVTTLAGLHDSNGNGGTYYDNYIYFARDTDIARYGPLNGAPSMTTSYWVGALGKTALTDTTYPSGTTVEFPNHTMCVQNGKLFISDVVGNQGVLHYIKTKKTTVEGDTDDGSTYNAMDFPYGMWPMAVVPYNSSVAVALYEGTSSVTFKKRAKLAIWDTVNTFDYQSITNEEFPDTIITALVNANGVIHTFSGEGGANALRVCRYLGGTSFEQVGFLQASAPPYQGGVWANLNRLIFCSYRTTGHSAGGRVYAIGSENASLGNQVFSIMGVTGGVMITSLAYTGGTNTPEIGYAAGLDNQQSQNYGASYWVSNTFRIGQRFQINHIRIPIATTPLTANTAATVNIYLDDNLASPTTVATVNSTNYPNTAVEKNLVIRPEGLQGYHSFSIGITWSGTEILTFGLPITIDFEVFDD